MKDLYTPWKYQKTSGFKIFSGGEKGLHNVLKTLHSGAKKIGPFFLLRENVGEELLYVLKAEPIE